MRRARTPIRVSTNKHKTEHVLQITIRRSLIDKISCQRIVVHQTPQKMKKIFTQKDQLITIKKQNFIPRNNILRYGCFQHVRINRARMIDWLVEICSAFKQSWRTYWAAVELLDILIVDHRYVTVQNIHLAGITSLLIASKFHEVSPLRIKYIVDRVVYGQFTISKIIQQEQKMLTAIFSVANLQQSTIYSVLMQEYYEHCQPEKLQQTIRQLIHIWQQPQIAMNHQYSYLTYKQLCSRVIHLVIEGKVHSGVQKVQNYYNIQYAATNTRKLYQSLQF